MQRFFIKKLVVEFWEKCAKHVVSDFDYRAGFLAFLCSKMEFADAHFICWDDADGQTAMKEMISEKFDVTQWK